MSIVKWLIYTVLLALTPIVIRLLVFWFSKSSNGNAIDDGDVVAFGLIVAITNINGLESADTEESWKTKHMGVSLSLIAMFATMFAAACFRDLHPEALDSGKILCAAMLLSVSTCLYSYALWSRLSALRREEHGDE